MEANSIETQQGVQSAMIISKDALLENWQGHRRLTRRVIEAFPEDHFYNYSIGGMRTFAQLTMEMIAIAAPGIRGIAYRDWTFSEPTLDFTTPAPATKEAVLGLWDLVTEYIDTTWPQIEAERFQEREAAFGMYEDTILGTTLYMIDNEIHHRGQGYVYLRALGIEPPAFWDRH